MLLSLLVGSVGVEDDVTGLFANYIFIKVAKHLCLPGQKFFLHNLFCMASCVFFLQQIAELILYFK